jgi:hypothetical protein
MMLWMVMADSDIIAHKKFMNWILRFCTSGPIYELDTSILYIRAHLFKE